MMASGTCSPSTVTVVLQLPWAASECSTAPESNAELTVMAPRAPPSGSRAMKLVMASATTDRASLKFFTRTALLPTLTL
jgi:hypothetical protein